MKKIYLALGFGLLILGANAQQKTAVALNQEVGITPSVDIVNSISTATTTALNPSSFANASCTLTAYSTAAGGVGGFIAGNNRFGDKEKAQRYSLSANGLALPATLNATYLYVALKKAGGPGTGVVTVKVYGETAGAPGTLLGTSLTKTISTLTAGSFTANGFTFASPVALTTDAFYVSVDFTGAGADTLSLAQTADGCASTNTISAWDKDAANAWAKIKTGWNLTTDFGIFPVITADLATGIKNSVKNGSGISAFPNPAANEVTINYTSVNSGVVEIEIYDVTGKLVNSNKYDNVAVGENSSKLDVSGLNSGVYMFSVKNGSSKAFSKFVIAK